MLAIICYGFDVLVEIAQHYVLN